METGMFGYYLDLAFRSLKRSPGITALMVLSIGVGVALAMTTWTLVHSLAGDPIPRKSARLFVPTLDMWGPEARSKTGDNDPPVLLDYGTAQALLRDARAVPVRELLDCADGGAVAARPASVQRVGLRGHRTILPDAGRAVPLWQRLERCRGRGARAGRGDQRRIERQAVRRSRQRRPVVRDRRPQLPRGGRAGQLEHPVRVLRRTGLRRLHGPAGRPVPAVQHGRCGAHAGRGFDRLLQGTGATRLRGLQAIQLRLDQLHGRAGHARGRAAIQGIPGKLRAPALRMGAQRAPV